MSLARRIIACLDVANGRVVKGTSFVNLRDVGDPVELAERYERDGADEIVFLDISASPTGAQTMLDVARRTAERVFIPLTIGGGIRTAGDAERALRAGADKIGINSAAVANPGLLTECAKQFGSQCVVASIDAKRVDEEWRVYVHGGRTPTSLDAQQWAKRCVDLGAGEVLLTSIDHDGARQGYDLVLTRATAAKVHVPVIASGGAGTVEHIVDVLTHTQAEAALVAGILHDGTITIAQIKAALANAGVPIRTAG
jgi:imidazole glycerol-phosphate synthase subunit HisF